MVLINLRYYPVDNVMMGIEYQYGKRENFSDGFHSMQTKFNFHSSLIFHNSSRCNKLNLKTVLNTEIITTLQNKTSLFHFSFFTKPIFYH